MKLKDFEGKEQELIGKTVLINSPYNKWLGKINRVTKKYFQLEGSKDYYELQSGIRKGDRGYNNRYIIATYASIISDESAANLRTEWRNKKEIKEMYNEIIKHLANCSHEQLTDILKIINKEKV